VRSHRELILNWFRAKKEISRRRRGLGYRIRIIAPVNTDAYNARILEAVHSVQPPDVEVDVKNIDSGHDCIESRWDLTQNAPGVVRLAAATAAAGYHGIFVTDFDMCGVEACRCRPALARRDRKSCVRRPRLLRGLASALIAAVRARIGCSAR
jgi:hypothetical protein